MEEDGHDLTSEQKNFIPKLTPTHILMFATGACGTPAVPSAQTCSNMMYLYVNAKAVDGDCFSDFITALMNGGIF